MEILSRISFSLIVVLSVLVAIISWRFIPLGIDIAFEGLGASVLEPRLPFVAHVTAAPIALALGGFQFVQYFRVRIPLIHRWSGRVYGAAILVGGLAALAMAFNATDRPAAAVGFGLLGVLWLGFTAYGIHLARNKQFAKHREYMLRSFALTFAAVTLRLQLPFLMWDGSTYLEVSSIVAWTAWVPNLVLVEIWLRRRGFASPASASGL